MEWIGFGHRDHKEHKGGKKWMLGCDRSAGRLSALRLIGICFFAAEGKGAQRTQKEEEREGGEVIFPLCSLCSLWLKLFEVASN